MSRANRLFSVQSEEGFQGLECECGNIEYMTLEKLQNGTSYTSFVHEASKTQTAQFGGYCKKCGSNWQISIDKGRFDLEKYQAATASIQKNKLPE